jgi:hypothetical protein
VLRGGCVLVLLPHHSLGEKIDERIGLGVHVIPIEQHLGVVQHLAQAPEQRLGVAGQRLVGAQRVQVPVGSRARVTDNLKGTGGG